MTARSSLAALTLSMAVLALPAAPSLGAKGGTPVLHLSLRTGFEAFTSAGGAGELGASLRQQGNADVQKLRLDLSGLVAEAPYHLVVVPRDPLDPTATLPPFDADENGEASFRWMHLGNGKKSFPTGVGSLSEVSTIEVWDEAVVPAKVLEASLADPDSLQYLVKRVFSNGDAQGMLFMKEHGSKALFRLTADGLGTNTAYTLEINTDDPTPYVGTFTSDGDGRLVIDELPAGAPLPFDITKLELLRPDMSVLFSTELP